jgi:hypothetical protein
MDRKRERERKRRREKETERQSLNPLPVHQFALPSMNPKNQTLL